MRLNPSDYMPKMSKKILIVNQNSGYLTIDVANAFKDEWDEVVVMFGLNRVTERNFHPDIKIHKTITYDRSSNLKRLMTWSICTIHLFFLLLLKYRDFHVLYYTNPPMSYFNSLFFRNPFGIVVFDTYPDALGLIGINKTSFVYRIWEKINKIVFARAIQIITLSEGMKEQLGCYVDLAKVKVVSVWSASESFKPLDKESNTFLKKYNWVDKFVVLYSGNMGVGHKLEVLIDVAESLANHKEIQFLFIGEGAKKKSISRLVEQKKLQNVAFLTWQDANILPYSLASGDISVVTLESAATHASVPSKTFNYMAVGSPILAIGGPDSELERIINKYNLGIYLDGCRTSDITEFILEVLTDEKVAIKFSKNSLITSKKFNHELSTQYLF